MIDTKLIRLKINRLSAADGADTYWRDRMLEALDEIDTLRLDPSSLSSEQVTKTLNKFRHLTVYDWTDMHCDMTPSIWSGDADFAIPMESAKIVAAYLLTNAGKDKSTFYDPCEACDPIGNGECVGHN